MLWFGLLVSIMLVPKNVPSEWMAYECLNWPDAYPYAPEVSFRVWHDSKCFHIEFKVREESTKAEQSELGAEVYQDSCVECFIQPKPEDPHYYNFEWNAAGHLAMACRTGRSDPEPAPLDVISSVKAEPSLGSEPFSEKALDKPWTLHVAIPITALFNAGLEKWDGLKCRMNFFKCGDKLKTPHYLTWAPIDTPKPDYHRPEFFKVVQFE